MAAELQIRAAVGFWLSARATNTLVNEMGKAAAFTHSSGLVLHSVCKDRETEGQADTRYSLLFAGSFEGGRPLKLTL